MRIDGLTLTDIKCFPSFRAGFWPGVNLIAGKNGAGKSTLVEAIGLTVFGAGAQENGYLDYFIRDGARTGEIRVDVTIGGEPFTIVRRLKKGASSRRVLDGAGNELNLHGDQDVDDFLKERLELGQNPAKLFLEVVGVRQGMLTEPFREPPAQRKRIFNSMLGVERYKQAAERIPELAQYIEDKLHACRTRHAVAASHTEGIEAVKEAFSAATAKAAAAKLALKQAEAARESAEKALEEALKRQQAFEALFREAEAAKAAYRERANGLAAGKAANRDALLAGQAKKEREAKALCADEAALTQCAAAHAAAKAALSAFLIAEQARQSAYRDEKGTLEREAALSRVNLAQLRETAGQARGGCCPFLGIPCVSVASLEEAIETRIAKAEADLTAHENALSGIQATRAAAEKASQAEKATLESRARETLGTQEVAQAAFARRKAAIALQEGAIQAETARKAALELEEARLAEDAKALCALLERLAAQTPESPELAHSARGALTTLHGAVGAAKEQALAFEREAARLQEQLNAKQALLLEQQALADEMKRLSERLALCAALGGMLRAAGARVAALYRERTGIAAGALYRSLAGDGARLVWAEDYDITLVDQFAGAVRTRYFRQLSGGEQMSAALALRLALLKELSPLGLAFFDEPTANLDTDRRESLARVLPKVTAGFEQVFLISHDDAFDGISERVLQL